MAIEQSAFGHLGEEPAYLCTMNNRQGTVLDVTNYGARITALHVADRCGHLEDVILGFDDLQGYVEHKAFFGGTLGRVANRIRNASFTLQGKRCETRESVYRRSFQYGRGSVHADGVPEELLRQKSRAAWHLRVASNIGMSGVRVLQGALEPDEDARFANVVAGLFNLAKNVEALRTSAQAAWKGLTEETNAHGGSANASGIHAI